MRQASLIAAAAIIVIANAFALIHAARNRSGAPDSELKLTQRELLYYNSSGPDDSGVALHLQWTDSAAFYWPAQVEDAPVWLDRQKLHALGFDCSVDPSSPDAGRHYQRQRKRPAFVALEYDGAAWRTWQETFERSAAEQRAKQPNAFLDDPSHHSHLVSIDADLDPGALRARHPSRDAVIILRAVIVPSLEPPLFTGQRVPKRPARVVGRIEQLPLSIHVPRPFSDEFRRNRGGREATYQVRLRNGSAFEPWIAGIDVQP